MLQTLPTAILDQRLEDSVTVESDVHALRRVLVHRPGDELSTVTADNARDWLFERPISMGRAQDEHDALTAALRATGADVVGLGDLAGSALAPRPNHMFTRDMGAVLGQSMLVARPATAVRASESDDLAGAIAASSSLARIHLHRPSQGKIEGGDVTALGGGVVAVGVGERTSRAAAEWLAARLLRGGDAQEVVLIFLPPGPGFHLDLVLTLVDHATIVAHAPTLERASAIRLGAFGCRGYDEATVGLARALDVSAVRLIESTPERHGPSWDVGVNVIAASPGCVIASAENPTTNARLARAGVEVWPTPTRELRRGRGGPHCMTLPLVRKGVNLDAQDGAG